MAPWFMHAIPSTKDLYCTWEGANIDYYYMADLVDVCDKQENSDTSTTTSFISPWSHTNIFTNDIFTKVRNLAT